MGDSRGFLRVFALEDGLRSFALRLLDFTCDPDRTGGRGGTRLGSILELRSGIRLAAPAVPGTFAWIRLRVPARLPGRAALFYFEDPP